MNDIEVKYKNLKSQIKTKYDSEYKDLKNSYSKQLKNLKQSKHDDILQIKQNLTCELNEYYNSEEFIMQRNPPKRSVLEEIGNAVTHGLGALFAIFALIVMLISSTTITQKVSAIIYGTGMFLSFISSSLYHSFKFGSKVKRLFRRFDYISIYLLIGATFAPILLCVINTTLSFVFFIVQCVVIIVGVTLVSIFGPQKIKGINFALYFITGWSGLIFIPDMISVSFNFFAFILGGGIIYTLGIIPFAIKKSSAHFIWHIFVLFGAITQWLGIFYYIF